MTDVNEEIVKIYYELKGCIVRSNLIYEVKKKKGSNYADVDLVVYNPDTKEWSIVEVRGWHTTNFVPSQMTNENFFNFIKPKALKKVEELIKTKNFKRILVISHLPKTEKAKKDTFKILEDNGIDDHILFKDILKFIFNETTTDEHHKDSMVLQMAKLFRIYGFLKDDVYE